MKQPRRQITAHDIYNLPSFLRVELIDGVIYTDDWTSLEIDEKVFEFPASENRHIKYKLSIVEIEEKEIPKP